MEFIPEKELVKAEDLIEKHHKLFIKLYYPGIVSKKKKLISIFNNSFFYVKLHLISLTKTTIYNLTKTSIYFFIYTRYTSKISLENLDRDVWCPCLLLHHALGE